MELSSVATAPIPTTNAAVSVFESSWYNQTEGTVFAEWNVPASAGSNWPNPLQFTDGTISNELSTQYRLAGAKFIRFYSVNAGVSNSITTSNIPTPGANSKTTFGMASANYGGCLNGGTVVTGSTGAMPTVNRALIGFEQATSSYFGGTIKRLVYWGQRLPNNVLQQITQP
jgi:hypothetical protein